jgi:dTDP-4-amino-4,6-dideoxygalactose transaminase
MLRSDQRISEIWNSVLEDSAEALGGSYKGQRCGTFGRYWSLSFNGNKIITTSGGGAIVTKKIAKDKALFLLLNLEMTLTLSA